jgi:alkanesulfonate monooxygenase SsuD/methylene tetrahydromethanopterin reductase-like flavin-dependent oxidoreductase (luciferase family)
MAKGRAVEPGSITRVGELTDAWPPKLAEAVGYAVIAGAQLERAIYLAAKRREGMSLINWTKQEGDQRFERFRERLSRTEPNLATLLAEAEAAWDERNDIVHATWTTLGNNLARLREERDLGVDPEPILQTTERLRRVRDAILEATG